MELIASVACILQPALQVWVNFLTQETGPPGRLSVLKFYLHSLCNCSSPSLSKFGCFSSRSSPSLLARDIFLACFNNLNLLGSNFQDKLILRSKKGEAGWECRLMEGREGRDALVYHRMFRLFHWRKSKQTANCLNLGLKPTTAVWDGQGILKCWLLWSTWVCQVTAQH